jgi:hypothetical protein
MKTNLKMLGLVAALVWCVSGRVSAAGNLWDNFEFYAVGDALSGKPGWLADPGVTVASNVFGDVTKVGALPPETTATNTALAGVAGKVWLDCQMAEAARMDLSTLPCINPAAIVMVGVTTDGYAVVYNTASNGWDLCTNDARGISVSGVASGQWAQVSLCEDFANTNLALFLNGRLMRQKVPFINTSPASCSALRFKAGASGTGYVDNVYASNSIPVALTNQALSSTNDINGDGIPDALEIQLRGSLAKIVPGDYSTITGALAAAQAGDRIVVSNAAYTIASITLSNGVMLAGMNLTGTAGDTNLTVNGAMTVVTGAVSTASGAFTVTGQVGIAAGGLMTISNSVANFGGLTIGGGGLLHVVNGALIVGSYTNNTTDFTLSLITNMVSSAGIGTISPSGTNTMISTWSNVVYSLQATNSSGYGVVALTNNGANVSGSLVPTGIRTWTYTNLAANITNNQTIVAAFVYNGIRYVPGDYTTVTGALATALANDRIVVSNRTYSGSITVSNGVTLVGTNMTGVAANTNLTINGGMSVVQTGMVYSAGIQGLFTVTGTVSIAAGGLLTISNTAANFGGLTIGGGGLLHVVNGALIVGSYTNNTTDFTLSLITNMVSSAGIGTISPSGTNTMISTWSNVTYTLTADRGFVVGSLTNNIMVTNFVAGTKTATYTDPAANITNNQIITAAFIYNGIRYVPGDYGTISGALAAALAGDQIVVSDGPYAETLVVSNNVTLNGTNVTGLAALTVLSNTTAVLSGFTTFAVTNLVIQAGAVVVVDNGTVVTVGGVTLTGPFTMNSEWATALTPSSINFTNDFEAYSTNQPLALWGGQGWSASDVGTIVQGQVARDAKAAKVVSESALWNVVGGLPAQSNIWTDVWINDSGARYAGLPYPPTNANRAVMLFVNTNNHVVIWNSNAWDECSQDVAGNDGPRVLIGQWVQISLFEDFTAQKVALFVNGQLVRQQVPFASKVDYYQGLKLNSGDGTAYLDDVKIWTSVPTGLTNGAMSDLDYDGIPDASEINLYGDLSSYPRGSVFKIR